MIEGAPADVVLSAAVNRLDAVARAGRLAGGSRRDLPGRIAHSKDTAPVVIGGQPDLPALLQGGRLSMATVTAVPAGHYGKAALEHPGLWAEVATMVARSDNVRAALNLDHWARCLIPWFDGVILSMEWKDALWDKFVMQAPRLRTPSEQQ